MEKLESEALITELSEDLKNIRFITETQFQDLTETESLGKNFSNLLSPFIRENDILLCLLKKTENDFSLLEKTMDCSSNVN